MDAAGDLIHGGVGHAPQHIRQAFRKARSVQSFLDEIRQGIAHLDAGPEEARQSGLPLLKNLHGLKRFVYGRILAAGCGFVTEAHEGSPQQSLQVGVSFPAQGFTHLMQAGFQQRGVDLGEKIGHFHQARGGFSPGIHLRVVHAPGIVIQDGARCFRFAVPEQLLHKLANVPRRDRPGLRRKEHLALVAGRHPRPELPVQNSA